MAKVKKTIKKAANGKQQEPKPTYKNLQMGVNANDSQGLGYTKSGRKPSSQDSALYRFGFNQGLQGKKGYPGEGNVQRMGRWEAQTRKALETIANKKFKNKKAQSGDSLKAKLMTEYGPKKFAVDTAGYSAGKQKFPATVSSKKSSSTKSVSRGTVNRMIGAPVKSGVVRQTRSQWKASKKKINNN